MPHIKKDYTEERLEKLNKIKKSVLAIETRSNEAMTTWQDGYGQDFVPSDLASQVINTVRNMGTFVSKLAAPIVMPTPTYTIPVEGGDQTWYATSEQANVTATAVTTSKVGTDDVVLTAKKYSSSVYASWELDEDSIVNIRSFLSDKFGKTYAELLDNIWINGDTETWATGNVNSDDGAPAAGTYYLHQNGLIKNSLVTNSKSVNAGSLDLQDIRSARKTLWLKGLDPSKLVLLVGTDVYFKMLSLTQVETIEKFGASATVVNGVLQAIDGIPVMPTSLLGNAEADGKKSTTANNNTLGRAVLAYLPDMLHGFKRNLQIFTEYLPEYDQFRFTGHVRYAIKQLAADSSCTIYNITL